MIINRLVRARFFYAYGEAGAPKAYKMHVLCHFRALCNCGGAGGASAGIFPPAPPLRENNTKQAFCIITTPTRAPHGGGATFGVAVELP